MQPNALLQLPPHVVDEIISGRSGQARLNELFRRATDLRLSRNIIATVAQQDDYMSASVTTAVLAAPCARRDISFSAVTTTCSGTSRLRWVL